MIKNDRLFLTGKLEFVCVVIRIGLSSGFGATKRADLRRTRAFGLHRQRSQSKDALEVDGVRLHREIAMPEHAAKPAGLFMAPQCLLSRRCWGLSGRAANEPKMTQMTRLYGPAVRCKLNL
jgi:hypothetical protein